MSCEDNESCQNENLELHTCPYREEIEDDHLSLCDCCVFCMQECRNAI